MIDTKTADGIESAALSLRRLADRLAAGRCKPSTASARLRQVAQDLEATTRYANQHLPIRCRHCAAPLRVIFRTAQVAGLKCHTCRATRIVDVSPAS
jgi:hypothetical protein